MNSIRDCARDLGLTYSKIQNVLKRNKFHDFKIRPVQFLTEENKRCRLEFCQDMLQRLTNDENLFNNILWTDEATFSTAGMYNRKNVHYWSTQNPRQKRQVRSSGRQSVHVWAGIYNNKVLPPVFFEGNLTGQRYFDFLSNEIQNAIEQIPLRDGMVWQQDGAPPHNVARVTGFLNNRYPIWIGRSGSIRWPANSPDLTLLDTFLWGFLKNRVYSRRCDTIQEIMEGITENINSLNNDNNVFIQNAVNNLKKRYRLCVENNGDHIEHLL